MARIELDGVTKIFGRRPARALAALRGGVSKDRLLAETGHILALRDVTLTVRPGEIFVVMGLSGSGKSTLIRHINRLIDPTAGAIRIDGVDILTLSIADLIAFRREHLAMVFQHFALFPHRTVLENAAYGLEVEGIGRTERHQKAGEWLAAVGLGGFETQYPEQLSGGMQQRVGLARALAVRHDILLMDEAFSALDPLIRSQMQELLLSLQQRLRKTIVFITHDLDEALRLGDTIAILRDGEVVQVGAPAEIILRPADDYVRAFVKDVNRARVLSVDKVMEPVPLMLGDETPAAALAEMDRRGTAFAYVPLGDRIGVVTPAMLREALAGPANRTLSDIAVHSATVRPEASLAAALPAALASPFPVPVVNASGVLVGVLSPGRLAEMLSPGADVAVPPAGG